jgi:hypothetical protein
VPASCCSNTTRHPKKKIVETLRTTAHALSNEKFDVAVTYTEVVVSVESVSKRGADIPVCRGLAGKNACPTGF